ncbi:MAG: hypothetical protein ACUVRH_06740 [Candidatus Bipolaricaulia bacterium]
MILAIAGYLAAFGLAWGPLAAHGFPWTMLLLPCPVAWIVGVILGLPGVLTVGLYAVVGLAVGATLSGAFLPGLGAVVLALLAWDAGGLARWLTKADEVPGRTGIWRALLLRSFGLGSAGAVVALGFSQLELSLPFWGLTGLLLVAWAALAAFRRTAAHLIAGDRMDRQRLSDD